MASLVIVNQIDVADLAGEESEYDTPVPGHSHCPEDLSFAGQRMQPPARHVEVLGRDGRLQRSQNSRNAKQAVLRQAGGVASLDPAPQPLGADRHPAVFPGLPESVAATRMG